MWIIDNSLDVHKLFNVKLNNFRNLATFDFSTLYTSIPHDKLKNQIKWVISKAFASGHNFIKVHGHFARWCNNSKKEGVYFSEEQLIASINWLIDNTYVTVGDKLFRQYIGILMGTDCAPFLANLCL